MARIDAKDVGGTNVVALLDCIAYSEIGPAMLADPSTDDGYRVLVGSRPGALSLFAPYDDHPLIEDDPIQYAPGCYSSAAGRYQILARYWRHYQRQLGLPDFGPVSQDRYAIQQFREQHALEPIQQGDLRTALHRCRNIWASIPGAGYGQHENDYDTLRQAYVNAGGIIWDGAGMAHIGG